MKPILLTFFLILTSCSKHESKDTIEPYERVDEIAASYLDQIKGLSDETLFPDRCDRITFISLASAFATTFDLSPYEWRDGEWHRDRTVCYPDSSRSEISFDGLISLLNALWTNNDRKAVERLADYGRRHDWVFGEGDRDLTFLPQIGVITDDMLANFSLVRDQASYRLAEGTHNEHILALAGLLKLRYSGFLETQDLAVLRNLKRNPLITAILARVDDGSQAETILYLSKFPDVLPLETGFVSWGGCPQWVYFFILKGVIDGK